MRAYKCLKISSYHDIEIYYGFFSYYGYAYGGYSVYLTALALHSMSIIPPHYKSTVVAPPPFSPRGENKKMIIFCFRCFVVVTTCTGLYLYVGRLFY